MFTMFTLSGKFTREAKKVLIDGFLFFFNSKLEQILIIVLYLLQILDFTCF